MLTNLMNMSGWLWLVVVQYGGLAVERFLSIQATAVRSQNTRIGVAQHPGCFLAEDNQVCRSFSHYSSIAESSFCKGLLKGRL
ncbi:hypothetical protein OUZ56_025131 [Daphnia magna]|uniref:Secreted protein n=1 Tax=Daphnia magna TaxID=35525 RepID=A0ABQ9ZIZ7_9CRUS|nr:hypothetical protein OUZ56_025131 [Daphnia magna]